MNHAANTSNAGCKTGDVWSLMNYLDSFAPGDSVQYRYRGGAWTLRGVDGNVTVCWNGEAGHAEMESLMGGRTDEEHARFIMTAGHRVELSLGYAAQGQTLGFTVDDYYTQRFKVQMPKKDQNEGAPPALAADSTMVPIGPHPAPAILRRGLKKHPDGSWRCRAYTATDFVEGFLVEGVRPQAVESLTVAGVNGRYEIEYGAVLEAREGGAYAPASTWRWTPTVYLPQAELVVRFIEGAPEAPHVAVHCVNTSPEYYDVSAKTMAEAALLGNGAYKIVGGADGFVLSAVRDSNLRLNPF